MTYDQATEIIRDILDAKLPTDVPELQRDLLTIALASKLESTWHRSRNAGIDRGLEIARIASGVQR